MDLNTFLKSNPSPATYADEVIKKIQVRVPGHIRFQWNSRNIFSLIGSSNNDSKDVAYWIEPCNNASPYNQYYGLEALSRTIPNTDHQIKVISKIGPLIMGRAEEFEI